MTCASCGNEVNLSDPNTLQRVVGWEQRRKGGGLHHLLFKEVLQVFMCGDCALRKKYGSDQGEQGKLL